MSKKTIQAIDYLHLWRDDPEGWSVIPSTYAAAMLDKSLPTIDDLVAKGKLTAIVFNGGDDRIWKGVTMSSLLRHMEDNKNKGVYMFYEAKKILEELAGQRKGIVVYYSDFMAKLGLNYNNPHHRNEIGKILCDVSRDSYQCHKFMLSVLVVNKKSGMPSEMFFNLAREIGGMTIVESREQCLKTQHELVYNHYRK